MNKLYFNIIVLITLFTLSGCNDWLDVAPRSQVDSESMFGTENGYKRAVNGVYIKLAQPSLYGKNSSMYVPETLAKLWTIPTVSQNEEMYYLSNYDYNNALVEERIKEMFSAYYNTIAQINDILGNLERNTSVDFSYNNDRLIKGELIGLRAFLHLEVLRLWGPIPSDAVGNGICIPYVTEMTNDVEELRSRIWDETLGLLEDDLNEAESILAECDPVLNTNFSDLDDISKAGSEGMPKDSWQTQRRGRFNYWAVLATKARFYHWIGNTDKSVEYARRVVESEKLELCNSITISASLTMFGEHLFDIENLDLVNQVSKEFDNAGKTPSFTQNSIQVDVAYEKFLHLSDIRCAENFYWEMKSYPNGKSHNVFYKYIGNNEVKADNRVPLIRLSEMYLILSEDLPLVEAKQFFDEFRIARAMNESVMTDFNSEYARKTRMEYEYRKEFYGEGQTFYFYKKHEYKKFWPTYTDVPHEAYVLPKPKEMSNFE